MNLLKDSTSLNQETQFLLLSGDGPYNDYLERINGDLVNGKNEIEAGIVDTIQVIIQKFSLTIDHQLEQSSRNTPYLRQLELKVLFASGETTYPWQGQISDKLSDSQVRKLLAEDFPGGINGDYRDGEPRLFSIWLTTLSIFSLVAALYFIRT